jgi:hypothetical protein
VSGWSPVLLIDGTGRLLLGYNSGSANVRAWDGSAWGLIGSPVGSGVMAFSVVLDNTGKPAIATLSSGGDLIQVSRWDGSTWKALPDLTVTTTTFPWPDFAGPSVSLAFDKKADPYVVSGAQGAIVSHWSSGQWQAMPALGGIQSANVVRTSLTGGDALGVTYIVMTGPGGDGRRTWSTDGATWGFDDVFQSTIVSAHELSTGQIVTTLAASNGEYGTGLIGGPTSEDHGGWQGLFFARNTSSAAALDQDSQAIFVDNDSARANGGTVNHWNKALNHWDTIDAPVPAYSDYATAALPSGKLVVAGANGKGLAVYLYNR